MMSNKYRISLSVEKRIILHLLEYLKLKNNVGVDNSITQQGIAESVNVRIEHVSRELKKMTLNNYIYSRTAYIKNIKRRKKAYFLTNMGLNYAKNIKKDMKNKLILIRTIDGEIREIKYDQLNEFLDFKLKPLEVFEYSSHHKDCIIDLKKVILEKE